MKYMTADIIDIVPIRTNITQFTILFLPSRIQNATNAADLNIIHNPIQRRDYKLSNSLIIHEAKTKENHKRDRFGNMIKHLHKLAKLPEVRICLRSCTKHSH